MSEVKELQWDVESLKKYRAMIKSIPLFHREIAKTVVNKKAEINAQERSAEQVEDQDIIKAFFSEVPMTFYSLMVRLMDAAGFDHEQWGPK